MQKRKDMSCLKRCDCFPKIGKLKRLLKTVIILNFHSQYKCWKTHNIIAAFKKYYHPTVELFV